MRARASHAFTISACCVLDVAASVEVGDVRVDQVGGSRGRGMFSLTALAMENSCSLAFEHKAG